MFRVLLFIVLAFYANTAKSEQTWHIVTENFPPYFSEELPNNGWLFEITKLALKSQNINTEIEFTSWNRSLNLLEKQKKTAILGTFHSKQRGEIFVYSRPLAVAHSGLFKLKKSVINYDGSLESLLPYNICKEAGDPISADFSHDPRLSLTSTANLVNSLFLLQNERVDLVAGTKEVGEYWIKHSPKLLKNEEQVIEYLPPHLAIHKLHLIVSESSPDNDKRIAQFEAGLEAIIKNGSIAKVLKKHHFSDEYIKHYLKAFANNFES